MVAVKPLVTVAVMVAVPAAVGVPERTTVDPLKVKPADRALGDQSHVMGVRPVAASV